MGPSRRGSKAERPAIFKVVWRARMRCCHASRLFPFRAVPCTIPRQDQEFREPSLQIAILDDDHVIRIARYALSGPGEVSESYVRDFFLPEDMDPARVLEAGRGLHEADGVSLVPLAAKFDIRKGSDVEVIIFRRGVVDAAAMDANPRLKLIQRIGARANSIDLAAAA